MDREEILSFLKDFKDNSANIFSDIGLFGSYAKNNADVYSDIDVAVRLKEDFLKKHDVWDYFDELKKIQNALFEKFHLKSDIFDLGSDSHLKESISREVIYV